MTTELQNKVWSILPKEFKEEVKRMYRIADSDVDQMIAMIMLENVFGHQNLTSKAEGEELLTCEKYKVEEALNYCDELDSISGSHNMRNWGEQMIAYLFGSKCLPDELNEDNFATKKPQPAEPKNEGTHQEQCVPKNAESGTHSFSHILKDDFRDHNRLHIAAMAMAGILSYGDLADPDEVTDMAIIYADELIEKCKKGGDNA